MSTPASTGPAIRAGTPADYEAVAAVCNAAWRDAQGVPVRHFSAAEFQEMDAQRAVHCRCARWVADQDGRIVGMGEYYQVANRYHPRKFWLGLYVHPEHQGRGIG